MKHAEDYYWVGQTSIVLTTTEIEYTGTQVPEFSFTNVMGADAKIYPGSAAVFDLDIIVPAGVDYAPLEVCYIGFAYPLLTLYCYKCYIINVLEYVCLNQILFIFRFSIQPPISHVYQSKLNA